MRTYRYGMLLAVLGSVLLLSACHPPHHPDPPGGYHSRDHRAYDHRSYDRRHDHVRPPPPVERPHYYR